MKLGISLTRSTYDVYVLACMLKRICDSHRMFTLN